MPLPTIDKITPNSKMILVCSHEQRRDGPMTIQWIPHEQSRDKSTAIQWIPQYIMFMTYTGL